jgi:hypothetical protein
MTAMRCDACGAEHELLDPAFGRPDAVVLLPREERARRATESDDLCSLGGAAATRWFVRCVLPVRLLDHESTLHWGAWAEVAEPDYRRILALWTDEGQAAAPPFAARLANRVPGLPDTLGLPVSLQLTGVTTRPALAFHGDVDHAFARECRGGVTVHRALEWLAAMSAASRRALVCEHVLADTRPILEVVHDHDGDWQLLCAGDDDGDAHVTGMRRLLERDPTLTRVLDLGRGQLAARPGVGSPWTRRPLD